MSDLNPEEVEQALDEAQKIAEEINGIDKTKLGEYELEWFLSTDGKHTVRAKATTTEGRQKALMASQALYDGLVKKYGTKAQAWEKNMNGNGKKEEPKSEPKLKCECGGEAIEKSGETNGKKWKGIFCQNPECKKVKWLSTKEA